MSVNSRLKTTQIIGQRKAFYRQRVPESSCARKETVDINIPVTSRNGYRKIMQSIRITSRPPSRKRKRNQLIEPVLKNIYQSNTYRKDLNWTHFDKEPRVQEKQPKNKKAYPVNGFFCQSCVCNILSWLIIYTSKTNFAS